MVDLTSVAVVTGASRGIGRAIALRLARAGHFVVVHYGSSATAAEAVVAEIEAASGRAVAFAADLADRGAVRAFHERLDRRLAETVGRPGFDVFVANAGVSGGRRTVAEVDEDFFDRLLDVNLRAPFFLLKEALPRIRDGGRIVAISSMGTRAAFPAMAAYAPAKAGLEALARLLAVELGSRGITVNAVSPGATATDMNPAARDPVAARATAATIALGRVGQPDDIAAVVAFLASPDGGWVTGQVIDASGGQRL
jgi:NAD(P)-dependent dehydrogenase (short-subunit alcohol dehydrogenase family)